MNLFGCKCCRVLQAENDHLRKWIDRLMDKKAPEVESKTLGALSRIGNHDDDTIFSTEAPGDS